MSNLQDLMTQKADLERRIAQAQREARVDAIAKVRSLMSDYGLTISDLTGRSTRKGAGKVAAKYRDASGNTWSGRGLKPKWLQHAIAGGKKLEDFKV